MSQAQTPMPPLPDYYEILQVHPKASPAVIKKAYRTLLMEMGHHPDLGGDSTIGKYDDLLKQIQKALGGKEVGLAEFKDRETADASPPEKKE